MRLCFALVVVGLMAACTSGPQPIDDTSHDQEILAWRADKDAMFKTQTGSPLLAQDRATFTGLPYFPINSMYRINRPRRNAEQFRQ